MAVTVATLPAAPERVFEVLSDPYAYADWVVGSDVVRDADASWPAPGSKLHHRVGIGPFKLNDNTEVLASEPLRRLILQARTRPLGTARITIDLRPEGGGTRVRMQEDPGDRVSRLLHNPIAERLLVRRNAESLRRLARLSSQGS